MSDWQQETVWNLQQAGVLLVEDGNHGEYRPRKEEFCEDGCPFIRPPDLIGGRVDFKNSEMINEVAVNRVRKGKGQPGDILFSHRATVGRMARVGLNDPAFVANPGVTIYRCLDEDVLDRSFLYFSMQHSVFMDQVWAVAGSTDTFPYASLTEQRKFLLQLPPIEEQREIAAVLGALDDKIELNRKTAATLEAMARALYRSWFVDFDPVTAKSEGRAPAHMAPATAALFPARFGPDGLPEGWRKEPLAKHVSVSRGLSYKGAGLCEADAGVPLHNLNSVFEGGGYKSAGIKYYSGDFKPRHEIVPGDLIVTNTEQGFDLLLMGHAALVPHHFGPTGLFSQHIYKVAPKAKSPLSREWLYLMLSVSPKGQEIRSYSNGTTVNMLPMDALEIPEVLIPLRGVVDAFDAAVKPMFARKESVEVENQTLATLRDTLLPRLMSGELRVGDARDLMAEVA